MRSAGGGNGSDRPLETENGDIALELNTLEVSEGLLFLKDPILFQLRGHILI